MGLFGKLKDSLRGREGLPAERLEGQIARTLELVVDAEQLQGVIMGYMVDLYGAKKGALLLRN